MAAPKLLDKRIVNAEVATQKKLQIDQGLSLAKKVDAVRETLQEEENRLELFRKETIARVHAEINAAIAERDSILKAIENREQELITLRKPLEDEWKTVQLMVDDAESTKALVYSMKGDLQEKIDENAKIKRMNEEETQRIEGLKEQVVEALASADAMKKDALKELQDARSKAESIIEEARIREEAISFREKNVEGLERNNSIERQRFTDWEKDLVNRETKLRVNQQILQRNLERNKQ